MDFGLKSYRPAQKLSLTEAVKKKRLKFTKEHLDWDTKMWKNVLFSDESSMKHVSAWKYRVWRPPGAKYNKISSPPL